MTWNEYVKVDMKRLAMRKDDAHYQDIKVAEFDNW